VSDKPIKVLLLEDEVAHAKAIHRTLTSTGSPFQLQIVDNLKQYREYVANNSPDVVLLDNVLQDGNGIELLRAPAELNDFPMILLTSVGNEQSAVAAIKAGALDYIVKSPDTFADMPHILTRVLNQWSSIQERKKAEQALQISETNFRNSIENSPLGIRIVTEEGETLYTNQAFLDIYGYKSIEEFKMTPVNERYAPESYLEFHERREKRQRREPLPDNYEVSIIRRDGELRHLHVVRKEILWAGNQQYQTIYQDITEHKRVGEALQESEEKYRLIVEKSNDILFTFNTAGALLYISPSVKNLLGYNQADLMGHNFGSIVHPEDMPNLLQVIQRNVKDGSQTPGGNRCRVRRVTGEWRWHNVSGNAVLDTNGKLIYFMAITRDITEDVQAENALKESETRYHQLVDTITSGVIIYKPIEDGENFIIVDINNAAEKMEGINRKDIIGKRITEVLPGSKEYDMFKALQKVWRTGDSEYFPANLRYGENIHGHWRDNWTYKLPSGEIVNVYNDVTDRKLAEKALQESETYLRATLDSTGDGILVVDNHQKIINTNNRFAEMFHIPGKFITQKEANPVLAHVIAQMAEPEVFLAKVKQLYSSSQKDNSILHLKDGRVFKRYSEPLIIQNEISGRVWSFRDDTELVIAEELLRDSEEKYRLIVEKSRDIIFTLDAQGKYVYTSPSAMKILGYNPAELIGKPFISLVHPDDIPAIEKEIRRSNLDGYQIINDCEYRIRHASGEWRWLVSNGTRTVDATGKFIHFIGIARDITERKSLEADKQRIEARAQVSDRLAAIGEMAAGIAHEINNPLTAVIGFSKLVLENNELSEELKEDLSMVVESSQRISDIIKGLLTFARQSKPMKTSVSLNEIIENTLKLREYVLKTNNIHVMFELDPNLSWTVVDPGQMQQVFLNLIVNAEQAMKKAHGRGTLKIVSLNKGDYIKLIVQDDGPGISRQNLERVFEPFFTTKDPGEGTGLGLSLSRSIILEHKGKMTVESKEGFGATFTIELPAGESEIAAAATAELSVAEPNAVKKLRILVVDDEPGVRKLLEKAFTSKGHSVDVISDAASAMEIIDAGTIYDIIITDVRMPGINGMDLYKLIIRRMPEMKNRVIVITGDVMGEDIKSFLTDYQIPYLTKPFKVKEIEEKIDNILTNKK
jgi:PAS domain S-box-containing protein